MLVHLLLKESTFVSTDKIHQLLLIQIIYFLLLNSTQSKTTFGAKLSCEYDAIHFKIECSLTKSPTLFWTECQQLSPSQDLR